MTFDVESPLLSLQVNPLDRRANYWRLWGNGPNHVENLPSLFLSDCSSLPCRNFAPCFVAHCCACCAEYHSVANLRSWPRLRTRICPQSLYFVVRCVPFCYASSVYG